MVKAAIVGLGYWGPNLLRNFASQQDCEILWGCDTRYERPEYVRKYYPGIRFTRSYEEVLADSAVELIIISTQTSSHFPLAMKALEAGKHVFIEKPVTFLLTDAERLRQIAQEQKRMIFVDHTFVFAPPVQKIVDLVRSGDLGDLLYFDSVRINLGLLQKDVNALWDLAIHDLSILSALVDVSGAQDVCAHGSKHFGEQEEDVHLHITFPKGFNAHIHVSWLSPVKVRQTLLGGTKAMVVYDDTQPSEKLRIYDRGIDHDSSKPDPFYPVYRSGDILIPAFPVTETLAIEAQHVLQCIQTGGQPLVGINEGIQIVRLIEAAQQSLQQGSAMIPLT